TSCVPSTRRCPCRATTVWPEGAEPPSPPCPPSAPGSHESEPSAPPELLLSPPVAAVCPPLAADDESVGLPSELTNPPLEQAASKIARQTEFREKVFEAMAALP